MPGILVLEGARGQMNDNQRRGSICWKRFEDRSVEVVGGIERIIRAIVWLILAVLGGYHLYLAERQHHRAEPSSQSVVSEIYVSDLESGGR